MKKAILIIISILLLSCLFASTALAAPAESMLLRAGGSVGGEGGGGFGGFSRSHRSSQTAEPVYAKDFTNNEHDYFWAKIEGSMIDYVIIAETGVIVQGTKQEFVFTEYWRFTRRRDGNWVLAEIMQQYDFEKTKYYKGLDKL